MALVSATAPCCSGCSVALQKRHQRDTPSVSALVSSCSTRDGTRPLSCSRSWSTRTSTRHSALAHPSEPAGVKE